MSYIYRLASENDLHDLVEIEESCFDTDRLNRRRFRHWIQAKHGVLIVCCEDDTVIAYGLVWCHKGTQLARLYSLGVRPSHRKQNIAETLVTKLEQETASLGRLFMRLEVAKTNTSAIKLYEKLGYVVFGEYTDYYDDHSDALRMQKSIQRVDLSRIRKAIPWYRQTTEFTCGPAALMMAMASQLNQFNLSQTVELDLWRQATTIFMTSGHGGTHPFGLALAARKFFFEVEILINTKTTPFIDGLRSNYKKQILNLVHKQFEDQIKRSSNINLIYKDVSQDDIAQWLSNAYSVIILISTYRLDGKKAPHWVTVTHIDDHCLYVHDPDCEGQRAIDCQHVPISREDFDKMSGFGSHRLRTALAIRKITKT